MLFSPGNPLSRFYNTAQVEDLASRGYVVVTIDHTHEGPVEFPGGRFVLGTDVLVPTADQTKPAIDSRVADTRFVLDRRIKAGVDLDGTLAYDMQTGPIGPATRRGLDRPFMLFGSDGSQRTDPANPDNYDRSWASFWKAEQGWKANLQLPGSRHPGLSDYQFFYFDVVSKLVHDEDLADQLRANIAGVVDRKRALLAQRTCLTAFFDQFLKGRPQPLLTEDSKDFAAVRFVR